MRPTITAILITAVFACACDKYDYVVEPCAGDVGESGTGVDDPCPPHDCAIYNCITDANGHTSCLFSVYLHSNHRGDVAFQLSGTGDLGWNELPYNLDAGLFEDAYLTGEGQMCGVASLSLTVAKKTTLTMICEDTTAGVFRVSDPVDIGN